jgi:phosphatidylglycerol:prolipoprotein diacylglycerol transferase
MLNFPAIDPVAIHLGPLAIRWYSLAYMAGILGGWWALLKINARWPLTNLTRKGVDDLIMWSVIGIILGGRLGYVLIYQFDFFMQHPVHIFKLWEGGMSFHGGMVGFIVTFYFFARKNNVAFLGLMDRVACVVPIGLFFGRIANFINGELYGRVTDVSWGMVFPHGGDLPRHPSQLYQAGMEGLLLGGVLLFCLLRTTLIQKSGRLSAVFLVGYGLARIVGELFREPDAQIGFLFSGLTMGQLLSAPMLCLGVYLWCKPNAQR